MDTFSTTYDGSPSPHLYNLSTFLLESVLSVPESDPGDRLLLPPPLEHQHRLLTVSAQVSPDNYFQVDARITSS